MKKFLLLALLITILSHAAFAGGKYVIGYYNYDNSAYPYTAIDYSNLTHICHAFIWPLADGSISTSGSLAFYPDMINAAHNHGVKVLVSIGGYGTSTQNAGFKAMVSSAASRAAFITNLVNFCKVYNYDGADFDWEYPRSDDRANFASLLVDLRTAFNANGIPLISAAVPSSDYNGGYDIPKLAGVLDWIGIMTYDFTGTWEAVGTPVYHNSALHKSSKQPYSIEASVSAWMGYGMPKSRICIGMPFYGYLMNAADIFSGVTSTANEMAVSYKNIDASYLGNSNWEYNFDNTTKNPYLRNKAHTQVLTFDDTTSIRMKCEYVNSISLGGTIIWKIAHSYNGVNNPLLEVVGDYLLKQVTAVASGKTLPEKFSLVNYPNPFNPVTKIRYTIPPGQGTAGSVKVRVNVIDVLGRIVSTLIDEDQSAGTHEIRFDAGNLSSGIYLCKIEAGDITKTQKMLLSK